MSVCVCVRVCVHYTRKFQETYISWKASFQGLKCRLTGIPVNIMSLENSHTYVWYVVYVCVVGCDTLSVPETVAPVGHSLTQYQSAGQGTDGRHCSNTAGFYHDGRPSVATPSDELQNN